MRVESAGARDWDRWKSQLIATNGHVDRVRSVLGKIASEISTVRRRKLDLNTAWSGLGVQIVRLPSITHGRSNVVNGRRYVYVNTETDIFRQHFTVAHEVAHLLLSNIVAGEIVNVDRKTIEKMCDMFSKDVMVPKDELFAHISRNGLPNAPAEVLDLCKTFLVNTETLIGALRPKLQGICRSYIVARQTGHPLRPGEIDYRVAVAAAGSGLFFPRHKRLSSMGFRSLISWADRAVRTDQAIGFDDDVTLKFWHRTSEYRSTISGARVDWSALLYRETPRTLLVVAHPILAGNPNDEQSEERVNSKLASIGR